MSYLRSLPFVLALMLGASPRLSYADVVNGGFETGSFAGWTQTGDTSFSGVNSFAAHTGSFGAFFGPTAPGGIAQTIATTPGSTYRVTFALALADTSQPNSFLWSWNGSIQNPSFTNAAAFPYTDFSSLVLAVGASSTLAFSFTNPQSFWLLDDVSVTAAVNAVPEPPTLALTVTALLLILVSGTCRRSNLGRAPVRRTPAA